MAFSLPTNFEQDLAYILPDYIWAEMDFASDELLRHFPYSYTDFSEVHYDQYANMGGLIPVRALGDAPDIVKMPALLVNKIQPGFYGLETLIEEEELTLSRQPNTINEPIDPADRLGIIAKNCATLTMNRIWQTVGTLATTGQFANFNASGMPVHRFQIANYQTFTPAGSGGTGPGWAANPATATPISDLIYWQTYFLNPGTSADYGVESTLLCNPKTVNTIWNTQQVQNTFKSNYGASFLRGDIPRLNGENSINKLFAGMGLPGITVYKEGYYPTLAAAASQDPTQFQYAIPDGKMVWIGKRPANQQIAALKLTRHAGIGAYQADKYPSVTVENEGKIELAKGVYVIADYHKKMPIHYELQVGFNMAPIVPYPRGIAGITVG